MSTEITQDSKPSYGVTFGKKVSDGAYGGDDFSVWVSADVAPDASDTQKYDALNAAANIAKALVYDHFKIEAALDGAGVIREVDVKRVERAFPNTFDVSTPSGTITSVTPTGAVRVKGQQHGELPSWLIEACAKDGVTEVWDNRDQLSDPANAWKAHFRATTKEPGDQFAKQFKPPKGR